MVSLPNQLSSLESKERKNNPPLQKNSWEENGD